MNEKANNDRWVSKNTVKEQISKDGHRVSKANSKSWKDGMGRRDSLEETKSTSTPPFINPSKGSYSILPLQASGESSTWVNT